MDFLTPELNDYIEAHTSDEPEVLRELNRETHAKVLMPRMLSGHFQGRFLSMISKMIRPACILEIGTYTGYSAICLSEGLAPNGKLYTIDINDELKPMVERYVQKANMQNSIELISGDAVLLIPQLNIQPDLVFIDADKVRYSVYYDLIFDQLKPGGYILADNVLWSGKVVSAEKPDKDTAALLDFNKKVLKDERVEKIILPIRDGLMLIRKK